MLLLAWCGICGHEQAIRQEQGSATASWQSQSLPNKPCTASVLQAFPVKSDLPHLSDVIDEELSRN